MQFPTAPGVAANTPVKFCGYQIGRITNVKHPKVLIDKKTGQAYHQTMVVMAIDKEYTTIPSNADIKLISRGLGSSYIDMLVDPKLPRTMLDPNRPETEFLVDGLVLQGSTGTSSEFFPEETRKALEDLVNSFKVLLDNTNEIIGDRGNQENLRSTLANLTEASKQATLTLKEVEKFSSAGAKAMDNANKKVEVVSVAFVETSEELNRSMVELRKVMDKINSGSGSMAMFLNDGRLYESLLDSAEELQVALKEANLLIAQSRKKGIPIKLK